GPFLPAPGFNGSTAPAGCTGPEGGTIRTGNIQVRSVLASAVQNALAAAGAGVFPTGTTFNGVPLSGATFGVGAFVSSDGSARGDLQADLTGVLVTGGITAGTSNADGTITLSGTGTVDPGYGLPLPGVPLVVVAGAAGIQLTVGVSALPRLAPTDGWVSVE